VHDDAERRNLFAWRGPAGNETVAIDWALSGEAAAGEGLVNLVVASVLWFRADVAALPELADRCLEGYVSGLAEADWRQRPTSCGALRSELRSELRFGRGGVLDHGRGGVRAPGVGGGGRDAAGSWPHPVAA
jgi:hypothetical protein